MGFAGKLCGLGKYKTPVQAGVQTDEVLALLFRLSTSLHLAKETTSMASSKKRPPRYIHSRVSQKEDCPHVPP